jgi:hypothetical protein
MTNNKPRTDILSNYPKNGRSIQAGCSKSDFLAQLSKLSKKNQSVFCIRLVFLRRKQSNMAAASEKPFEKSYI